MSDENDAIGIFDSGVGGLTVLREISARMPLESVVYLGDTARVPYGTKSRETVIRYARACSRVLLERGVKLIVVACNTASAHAVETLCAELGVPVLGVIEPGARAAAAACRGGHVGVIGTAGTIASGAYTDVIRCLRPELEVHGQACPLFVPLAEEGWTEGEVPKQVARRYLAPLLAKGIDTLVLGCTHYPLLKTTISDVAGEAVTLVDSAASTAAVVEETLRGMGMCCSVPMAPRHRYFVSDVPAGFGETARRFLGSDLGEIEWVDF